MSVKNSKLIIVIIIIIIIILYFLFKLHVFAMIASSVLIKVASSDLAP